MLPVYIQALSYIWKTSIKRYFCDLVDHMLGMLYDAASFYSSIKLYVTLVKVVL